MLKTTLVVPCYNEAQRFPLAEFTAFLERHPTISFVLVNDGSTDGTTLVLEKLRSTNPLRAHVIARAENRGKAESVREGMLAALALAENPQVVGFWDADLATPLSAVFDMLPKLEDRPALQMVFGARVALLGREIRRQTSRHYLGRIFATVVSVMLGLPIYDTQCGAKLFRVGPLTPQLFHESFSSRWVFDVEIIARWLRANRFDRELVKSTIYEFPLYRWEDVGGSKVKPYDFILAFWDVLRIYRRYF
jgi:dolichyl-phosphate beta-glucosyltransferase